MSRVCEVLVRATDLRKRCKDHRQLGVFQLSLPKLKLSCHSRDRHTHEDFQLPIRHTNSEVPYAASAVPQRELAFDVADVASVPPSQKLSHVCPELRIAREDCRGRRTCMDILIDIMYFGVNAN